MITDNEIDNLRIAGEITYILKNSEEEEKKSLLDYIELNCGISERARLENWINDGMPGA